MKHTLLLSGIAGLLLMLLPVDSRAMALLVTSALARVTAPAPQPAPPAAKKPPATVAQLAERLRSSDNNVVIAALEEAVQGHAIPVQLVPEFDRILRTHSSVAVRLAAIEATSWADNVGQVLPALGVCLMHANPDVRSEALDVIADTEDKVAIDILIAHHNSAYADVREGVQDNLELITDKEFKTQAQWQAWWKKARANFTF